MRNKKIQRILSGIKRFKKNKWLLIVPMLYLSIIAILLYVGEKYTKIFIKSIPSNVIEWIIRVFAIIIGVFGVVFIIFILGTPICGKRVEQMLEEVGFIDKTGETPTLLSKTKDMKGWIYEFYSPRLPLYEFEKHREEIETAMNINIVSIEYGKDRQHIKVKAISSAKESDKLILWNDKLLESGDFVIKLGESYFGAESCNLAITPHWLIGGGSGSGKSKLLKFILMQGIKKGAIVYLADFKGGVDYPLVWHEKCFIITEQEMFLEQLDKILEIMEERRTLFVEARTSNLNEYNCKTDSDLKRIIVACDEVAEVMDKTGLDKDEKAIVGKIESKISTIARLGRAFGIHLILATQRPDADVLKGQIKNNIGMRICGRADKVLSQIILDNSEGAEKILPDSQGLFITNSHVLFKAYYVEDECLNGGGIQDGKNKC